MIDGQEDYESSKMIHPREANLEEEMRTSFKAEGSTREAGDPRSKTKSVRGSLGLYFYYAFLATIVGYLVIEPIRLAIDITVRIFNL